MKIKILIILLLVFFLINHYAFSDMLSVCQINPVSEECINLRLEHIDRHTTTEELIGIDINSMKSDSLEKKIILQNKRTSNDKKKYKFPEKEDGSLLLPSDFPDGNQSEIFTYYIKLKEYDLAYKYLEDVYFDDQGRADPLLLEKIRYIETLWPQSGLRAYSNPPYFGHHIWELDFPSNDNNLFHAALNSALSIEEDKLRLQALYTVSKNVLKTGSIDFLYDNSRNDFCRAKLVRDCLINALEDIDETQLQGHFPAIKKKAIILSYLVLGAFDHADQIIAQLTEEELHGIKRTGNNSDFVPYFAEIIKGNNCKYEPLIKYESLIFFSEENHKKYFRYEVESLCLVQTGLYKKYFAELANDLHWDKEKTNILVKQMIHLSFKEKFFEIFPDVLKTRDSEFIKNIFGYGLRDFSSGDVISLSPVEVADLEQKQKVFQKALNLAETIPDYDIKSEIMLILSIYSSQQEFFYNKGLELWRKYKKTPENINYYSYRSLAISFLKKGNIKEAFEVLELVTGLPLTRDYYLLKEYKEADYSKYMMTWPDINPIIINDFLPELYKKGYFLPPERYVSTKRDVVIIYKNYLEKLIYDKYASETQ